MMKQMLVRGVALALMGFMCGGCVHMRAVKDSAWNVMDYGADPTGTLDSTEAFQKALDEAGAAKGGEVLAPTGIYRFDGNLNVPPEVWLKGVFGYAPAHAGVRDKPEPKPEYGTVFRVYAGAGTEAGSPFIQVNTNATLSGVCIYYPEQVTDAAPVPYPFAVALRGNNPAVYDVELLNPYQGIDATSNQRALVRNVHGQPLRLGLRVDHIYDIGRVENVHWNPWWSYETPVFKWQLENGTGFEFGQSDWQSVLNSFCFGYNVGFRFFKSESGMMNGSLLGIGADRCRTSVVIEDCYPYGLLFTNSQFVSIDPPDPCMVRVAATNKGVARFVNCAFWGPAKRVAHIEGRGTVGFSDCTFEEFAKRGESGEAELPTITALGGTVLIRGCEFRKEKPHILIGEGVERAIVTENMMRGMEGIENQADPAKVIIANNLALSPK